MARFKLIIEYDGTRYNGWQVQKGEKTIQGSFFDACKSAFGDEKFEFFGAGRTDGGVHALAQTAHLEAKTELTPLQLKIKLNENLPYDINVLRAEKALPDFHARRDATSRSYVYLISQRKTAFGKNHVWWVKDRLDLAKMQETATSLAGFKDYRSFTDPEAETASTKVNVYWIDIFKVNDLIAIHITGSHFLWKMVRRLAGVIVEAGRGKFLPEDADQLFTGFSPFPAKVTAPPSGLYLQNVYYRNEIPARGINYLPKLLNFP